MAFLLLHNYTDFIAEPIHDATTIAYLINLDLVEEYIKSHLEYVPSDF